MIHQFFHISFVVGVDTPRSGYDKTGYRGTRDHKRTVFSAKNSVQLFSEFFTGKGLGKHNKPVKIRQLYQIVHHIFKGKLSFAAVFIDHVCYHSDIDVVFLRLRDDTHKQFTLGDIADRCCNNAKYHSFSRSHHNTSVRLLHLF